ncbi:MAG TPA: isoprenylcysteine carboxylmethyltransferase family protein [Methanosarcina sp.]|nr:isoprenylcysteine carboxylmethyltransferase family protein [Methanosarcina sp.]
MSNIEKRAYNLKIKTLLGFVQLIFMLGLSLFLPAGSFNFWQAWVYLIIFIVSSAAVTVYLWKKDPKLLESRVKAGPGAEKEKAQKIIQLFASICFIAILVIPSLDHRFGWSNVQLYIVVAGNILVVLGFFLIFLVFKENTFAAATVEMSTDQKVITTGPYSIVRHPMYISALIMLFGTPLALGSWWGLVTLIPMTLIIVLRLLDEEKFLLKNLRGYKEYCQKTRYRLIPFIW